MQSDFDHCTSLVREADKDRYLASLFAPSKQRQALHALYAFNVEIGRVRDVAREPMPGEIRLQWWREVLTGDRGGEAAANPVAAALLEILTQYRVTPDALVELIDARTFDLYDHPMHDLAELETYVAKTDAVLFAISAHILSGADISAIARRAGAAHAIAGILSALPLHASRRQLYLPLDVLARHGVNSNDIFAAKDTPELRAALAELRIYARRQLAAAGELRSGVPDAALPALLPAALTRPMLNRMERSDYDPFHPQHLPQAGRQWALWRASRRPDRIFG